MNPHYRQAIGLFGIALPLLGILALIGGGFYARSAIDASFEAKAKLYRATEAKRLQVNQAESVVVKHRPHQERWNTLLEEDTLSTVNNNLRDIIARLPQKEIQKGGFERTPPGRNSIASQKSSEIKITFRGTFRTMQLAFLELETRMPNLQLLDFQIAPAQQSSSAANPGAPALLNFQISYLAWEN